MVLGRLAGEDEGKDEGFRGEGEEAMVKFVEMMLDWEHEGGGC